MSRNRIAGDFIAEIKTEFPEVGNRIDKRMADLGYDAEKTMYADMMECFSQATTDAIKVKDTETAAQYLSYVSNKLKNASEIEREYIDVYYTQPLMWDIKDSKIKSWGWKLFPENLKQLYEYIWGKQDL